MLHRALPFVLSVVLCASPAVAGDLTPPVGPVAPTMKTLDEVEPRIAVSDANTPGDANAWFVISQPGSYYLTESLLLPAGKSGIAILSDNVTLDLMGFSVRGQAGSLSGITTGGDFRTSVVIRNGIVANWGQAGILAFIDSGRIENITATLNGTTGISNDSGSFMTHIIDCEAQSNGEVGISVGRSTLIRGCVSVRNGLAAISASFASSSSIIDSCIAQSFVADGIVVASDCVVRNCRVSATGAGSAAIRATGARNLIENNSVTSSTIGLFVGGTKNIVRGNLISGNIDNFQLFAGNQLDLVIADLPESIDWPANVTIAGNLTRTTTGPGITIASDDVTLDLGGYALIGNSTANVNNNGVVVSGIRSNIVIRNGMLRNWGAAGADLNTAAGVLIERLNAEDNLTTGIITGSQAIVRECRAFSNGGNGFSVGSDTQIENCASVSNDAQGFVLGSRVRIRQCEAITNGVVGNFQGISASAASVNGYIENCFVMGNDVGIQIFGTGWTVIRNVAKGNTANYSFVAGNHAGTIVASPAGSGANDNISN
jgi:parallel beta-helix repeat protein